MKGLVKGLSWFTRISGVMPAIGVLLATGGSPDASGQTYGGESQPSAGWTVPVGAKLEGLTMFDGWTDPREVKGDVNAPGWPDSSYILGTASKGYELHYSYSRYDFEDRSFRKKLNDVGLVRPGQVYPAFNLFKAKVNNGEWVSERLPFNPPGPLDYGAGGMAESGSPYVFVCFYPRAPGQKHATSKILEVTRDASGSWGPPIELPYPINTQCVQDNPTLSADGLTLYFDSDRKDVSGKEWKPSSGRLFNGSRTIFVSHFRDGHWNDPIAVAGAPNNEGTSNMQPFLTVDGRYLYWTGFDRGSKALNCFYKATLAADGSFQNPILVAEPTEVGPGMDGKVIALGESSISEDGELLTFVFVRARITAKKSPIIGPADTIDIGIALARRIHN